MRLTGWGEMLSKKLEWYQNRSIDSVVGCHEQPLDYPFCYWLNVPRTLYIGQHAASALNNYCIGGLIQGAIIVGITSCLYHCCYRCWVGTTVPQTWTSTPVVLYLLSSTIQVWHWVVLYSMLEFYSSTRLSIWVCNCCFILVMLKSAVSSDLDKYNKGSKLL